MATLKDVALKAGVNVSTVSRALSGSSKISPHTVQRIRVIAQELNYQPNLSARVLAGKSSKMIGMIAPEIDSNYFAKLICAVEISLKERGYSLIVANSQFEEKKEEIAIEMFLNYQVEGIFLASSIHFKNNALLRKIREEHNVGLVLLEALAHYADYNYVMIDDAYGIEKAVEYLIAKGHKNIGFISDHLIDIIRKPMFCEALKRNGLRPEENPIISHPTERYEKAGYEVMNKFLDMANRPTAYIAGYDDMAIGAIRAVEDRGLSVPEDIAIIGNDNIRESMYLHKALTTLAPPVERMAQLGVDLMIDFIENNNKDIFHQITLKPELLVRETT